MSHENRTRALVESARDGDRAAFDEIVARWDGRLRAHVERRLGVGLRRRVTTDDIVADAWSRAWRGLASFEWAGEAAFGRWLATVAERVILSVAGSRRPDEVVYLENLPETPGSRTSPSREARRHERFERLEAALGALEPDQREALLLVRVEGLKLREAGEKMGRSQNAVMHLLRRALRKLRSSLPETESFALPARRLRGLEDDEPASHGADRAARGARRGSERQNESGEPR